MTASRFIKVGIFVCILLAFLPVVLSNNYLRQDDLTMWMLWPGMKLSDTGVYFYNTVHQLVRPLCMLTFFMTDMISATIHPAVYIRGLSIISLGGLALLLYQWQILFNPRRLLAATFAVSAFTLPPFQVFAATQNYFLILVGLLLAVGSAFAWRKYFYTPTDKRRYLWLGNVLFLLSCLEYPLSSMFVWVMLAIAYINSRFSLGTDAVIKHRFVKNMSSKVLVMMLVYYGIIIAVHHLFPVDYPNFRTAAVNTSHPLQRFTSVFTIMSWYSNFWLWKGFTNWLNSPIGILCLLFAAASWTQAKQQQTTSPGKAVFSTLVITFALLVLAYSPVLATPDLEFTFRYAIAVMPLLLYVFYWSMASISEQYQSTQLVANIALVGMTVFGVVYANRMLADGIVGPNTHDFDYVQAQLATKALPYLKNHQRILIHVIDCDNGSSHLYPGKTPTDYTHYVATLHQHYNYAPNLPMAFEYSMRTCQFTQLALSVVVHSLNAYGYPSNFGRPNAINWNTNEIAVKQTPWGDLVVNGVNDPHVGQFAYHQSRVPPVITIDMRQESRYEPMQFYKKLFHRG